MRILGIDPGYGTIGFGAVAYNGYRFEAGEYGAIKTPPGLDFPIRLRMIYDEMTALLKRTIPDAMSVEQLFFTKNVTTGIDVAQARGVILLAANQAGVPVFQYTPVQVKQSVVGYGKAEKAQVMEMTRRLLSLKEVPRPDDTADALAVAICHAHNASSKLTQSFLKLR